MDSVKISENILGDLIAPDTRWQYFDFTLQNLKQSVDTIELSANVPEGVRSQIDICKKLFLYSYFVYEFATIAMERSFMAIESALKLKYKIDGEGEIKGTITLKRLLDWAVDNQKIEERFPGMKDTIRHLRNSFAHPERQNINTPFDAIWCFSENVKVINSLFDVSQSSSV
ncbi:MAG: hypothetical protein KKH94_09630 [Candidatus Omnitrophica bacterium]|nr:hypothetical protein [Candidatus Omnitrophota bacterium]